MDALGGLTYASQSLRDAIAAAGWAVSRVKFDSKRDKYEALAKNERGEEVKQIGRTERLALSNLLLAVTRRNGNRRSFRLGRWKTDFSDQLAEIAQAYAKAPLYDAKASASFMALAKDCERRAEVLGQHLQVQIVHNPEPYPSPDKMIDDIKKRRKLEVSRVGADQHPLWSEDQVLAYRICHDVLGYAAADAGWDWYGECQAFAAHVHLIPAEAQKALFTESIAAAAYASYFRAYGPEKVVVFPQFMDRAQESETGRAHPGQHPSQSFPPVELPEVEPEIASTPKSASAGPENAGESLLGDLDGLHLAAVSEGPKQVWLDPDSLRDPNDNWQSGEAPILTSNGQTIAQAYGDPLGIETPNAEGVTAGENAYKIIPRYGDPDNGVEWAYLNQQDPAELAAMKQAITNAFRVVLLSPRKDLMWNAIHYQDIMNIPGDEDDPEVYTNTLERARQDWNEARGYDRYAHIPYMPYIKPLINLMYQRNPERGYDGAREVAMKTLHQWGAQIEARLMEQDEAKPEAQQRMGFQIATKANYLIEQKLKDVLKKSKPDLDRAMTRDVNKYWREQPEELGDYYRHAGVSAQDPVPVPAQEQDWLQQPDKRKYGAFMGGHLRAVAAVSKHVDDILRAALQDVHERNGEGWHFRSQVLQLGIPGVGPKVCSFAWLLLQPMTSELAAIDTHILDTLGIHNERQYSNRDYFGYERALRARMDAAGYSHVPLGQLQWAMWDYKRTGPGSHQDHSAMRALSPMDHSNIPWDEKQQPINSAQALAHKRLWFTGKHPDAEWWSHTADAGDATWDEWSKEMRDNVPKHSIPYQGLPLDYLPAVPAEDVGPADQEDIAGATYAKLAVQTSSLRVPWFRFDGAISKGLSGQTLMEHITRKMGLTVPEVWSMFANEQVGKHPGGSEIPSPDSIEPRSSLPEWSDTVAVPL